MASNKKEASEKVNTISVKITDKEIAKLIGDVCSTSYGVLGLSSIKASKDEKHILLKEDNYIEGILVKKEANKYVVDVHVNIVYGVKISEVVNSLSKHIFYSLEKEYGKIFKKVNIFVEELQVL